VFIRKALSAFDWADNVTVSGAAIRVEMQIRRAVCAVDHHHGGFVL